MRTSLKAGAYTVCPWPPRLEPECLRTYDMLTRIIEAKPDGHLWDLHQLLPKGVVEANLGWKAAFLWEVDVRRCDDLAQTKPALLKLLAAELPLPVPLFRLAARQALSGNLAQLLDTVGYPASRALARVIGRLPVTMQRKEHFRRLRDCWQVPWRRKLMCHVKIWTHDVLEVLEDDRASYKLLEAAAETEMGHRNVAFALSLLRGEWDAWLHHQEGHVYSTLPRWPYHNLAAGSLHAAAYRLQAMRMVGIKFREPPLPDRAGIEAITDMLELHREGRRMRNCLVNYHQGILEGEYYAYTLRREKCRCTILIRSAGEGWWRLVELRAYSNALPSFQAIEEVLDWMLWAQPNCAPEWMDARMDAEYDAPWDEEREEDVL